MSFPKNSLNIICIVFLLFQIQCSQNNTGDLNGEAAQSQDLNVDALEICDDFIDNDQDNLIDCDDDDCANTTECLPTTMITTEANCSDGLDDDGDGFTDCDDADCLEVTECAESAAAAAAAEAATAVAAVTTENCSDGADNDGDGAVDCGDSDCASNTACDGDSDGILDETDNCPSVANANQSDIDADGTGDGCDADADGDGLCDHGRFCLNHDLDPDGTVYHYWHYVEASNKQLLQSGVDSCISQFSSAPHTYIEETTVSGRHTNLYFGVVDDSGIDTGDFCFSSDFLNNCNTTTRSGYYTCTSTGICIHQAENPSCRVGESSWSY